LLAADANFRAPLKAEGFLTRDPRMKERKKYGQPGARNGSSTANVNRAGNLPARWFNPAGRFCLRML